MNELAIFAGAGGGLLAGDALGFDTVCAVEWNPWAASVLAQRQNDGFLQAFPIWDDIRTFDGRPWRGAIDVVSGGFPCQAYSTAARGNNTAEDLWPEMRRVVADVAPWCVVAENVAQRAIDHAADDLEKMGYQTRAVAVSAKDVGADHIRGRFWLLAYADSCRQLLRQKHDETSWVREVQGSVWDSDPGCSGVAYGLADRVDRIGAAGNGQVPLSAIYAWHLLTGAV